MKRFFAAIILICCTHAVQAQLFPVHTNTSPQNAGITDGLTFDTDPDYIDAPSYPNYATSAQWHTAISSAGANEDWAYSIVETDKKDLIIVGYTASGRQPTISKLDNQGQLVWTKTLPIATLPAGTSFPTPSGSYPAVKQNGMLLKVIKAPGGIYVAVGFAYMPGYDTNTHTGSGGGFDKAMILTEFNDAGNLIVPPVCLLPSLASGNIIGGSTSTVSSGYNKITSWAGITVALDPISNSANSIIIGGDANFENMTTKKCFGDIFIMPVTISGTTVTAGKTYIGGNNFVPYTFQGIAGESATGDICDNSITKILTQKTSSTTYDIYACGYASASSGDKTIYPSVNETADSIKPTYFDKDAWLARLTVNTSSSAFTFQSKVQLNKTNIKAGTGGHAINYSYTSTDIYPYQEMGPYSSRNYNTSNDLIGGSPGTIGLSALYNVDERASDMVLSANGKVEMVVNVNNIGDATNIVNNLQNGNNLISGNSGNIVGSYGEYRDCDVFMVQVPEGLTTLIPTTFKGQDVGHFSGTDFNASILQDKMNRYIIGGSTADSYAGSDPNLPAPADTDGTPPAPGNTFLVCTDDSHTNSDIWRRSMVNDDSRLGANHEDCFCVFGMANTSDDGYVIAGNNDNNDDDYSITKFAPLNENNLPSGVAAYQTFGGSYPPSTYTLPAGTTTWSSDINIASQVIVPSGATLNISSCTIQFASARGVYDYSQFPTSWAGRIYGAGILVEPGGRVNITSSTLRGLNFTQAIGGGKDRNMWDGIVVQGNPNSNSRTAQGIVVVRYSLIQDAVYGFYVADNYRTFTDGGQITLANGYSGETYTSSYNGFAADAGGIVASDTSKYLDCRFGFTFQGNTTTTVNESSFFDCTFNTDTLGMGDICLYADTITGHTLPARTYGSSWKGRLTAIDDSFVCASTFPKSVWPIGLLSSDAALVVTRSCSIYHPSGDCAVTPGPGNVFLNLSQGIVAGPDLSQASAGARILYNTFANNSVNSIAATSLMSSLQISNNNIYTASSVYNVLLTSCVGYDVSLNSFKPYVNTVVSDYGIVVNNGDTTDNEIVQNNTFVGYGYPCIALGTNGGVSNDKGLQFHCNTFGDSSWTCIGRLTVAGTGGAAGSLKLHQGQCVAGSPTTPAGNQFPSICYNSVKDRLWADANSASHQPNVFYHYNQSGTVFDPTGCYQTAQYAPILCSSVPNGDSANIALSCPPPASNYVVGNFTDAVSATQALDVAIAGADSAKDPDTYNELQYEHSLDVAYVARYYSFEAQYDSGGIWLERYGLYAQAFSFYLDANDSTNAARMEEILEGGDGPDALTIGSSTSGIGVGTPYATLAAITMREHSNGGMAALSSSDRHTLLEMAQYNSITGYIAAFADTLLGTGPMLWPVPQPMDTTLGTDAARIYQQQGDTATVQGTPGSFTVYPNPTTGVLIIDAIKNGTFSLHTLLGQQVTQYTIVAGQTSVTLPASLASGVYLGTYQSNEGETKHQIRIVLER